MSDITFSATMDEKDVQRALQNMVKENAKLRAEIGLGVQESKSAAAQEREWQKLREKATKDATSQMQQLNNAAQRIKDSVATPFEEAKKKAAELRDHLQAGRITVDEYRKAYAAVGKEMKEASRDHAAEAEAAKAAAAAKAEASKKAAEAERDHSQAVREATAVADKYATKEERVAAELKRLNTLKEKGVLSSKDYARAVEAEQKKLSETGDAADKSGGLIGGLTTKMSGFVSGLASGAAVISVLKAEYDALIERQGKSKDVNISLAAEQEQLVNNLGGASGADVAKQIGGLSKDSGIKEIDVTRAVNEAMSARGESSVGDVVKAVGSASKISKFAPSQLSGLAAATLDTQHQTGLGTDESLGFLLQMQGLSRTKSLKDLAANFTPAVGGVMKLGADRETAGAMLASLSHGMGDSSGAMTGTSGIQLAKQLREYGRGGGPELQAKLADLEKTHAGQTAALTSDFDKRGIALNAEKMPAEKKAELRRQLAAEEKERKQALKDMQAAEVEKVSSSAPALPIADVLARMQKDPAYREQFLKGKDQGGFGASFEAKALPAIEGLLSGKGQVAKDFAASRAKLAENPLIALEQSINERKSMSSLALAETDQRMGNASDQMRINDKPGAMSAIMRDRLREIRDSMGKTTISSNLDTVINDLSTGGMQNEGSAVKSLEGLKAGLKPSKQRIFDQMQREEKYNFNDAGDRERFNATAKERFGKTAEGKQEALLQALIDEIKAMRGDQQQGNHAGNVAARAQEGRP